MTRKRRKWVVVGVAVFVTVAGALLYLAVREDPRYVVAAETLPEVKAQAELTFSPLSWQEYREQNGVNSYDYRGEWQNLFSSASIEIGRFAGWNSPKYTTNEEAFLAHEAWFAALPEEIALLKLHHVSDGGVIWTGSPGYTKPLAKYIGIAIEATAGLGRVEDLKRYVRTGYQITEYHMDEPAELNVLMGNSIQGMVTDAALRAAVKNRDNPQVVAAIAELLDVAPVMPDAQDISAGQARTWEITLARLRELKGYQIGPWLEYYEKHGPDWDPEKRSFRDHVEELWEEFRSGGAEPVRRTGSKTTAALEARLWQVLLARAEVLRTVSFTTGEGADRPPEEPRLSEPKYFDNRQRPTI
ncbi:MAG: hypothetical protein IH945_09770, partial [Armatimonadetes bacterium]|nr:hypothetical protein [Armatimonadota bacterium]